MTEKRFHFGYVLGDTGLIDEQATEHKRFIENCCSVTDLRKNWKTVCDKLNEVDEENQQSLKKRNDALFNYHMETNIVAELKNENKQLTEENEALKNFVKNNFNEMMKQKMIKEIRI